MITQDLASLLSQMWTDYCELNPGARTIYQALVDRGEVVVNDHIALRTINHSRLGIKALAQSFEKLGYVAVKDYKFTAKKLSAWHFENKHDPQQPKIFISELELEKCSVNLQKTLNQIAETLSTEQTQAFDFSVSGRHWPLNYKSYQELSDESEYAGWFAAFGFRPNHFTVSVNHLKTFKGLSDLNDFILGLGFEMNTSGGLIKGSAADLLEQSSTMAPLIQVKFNDGAFAVPSCYYEFALRYQMPNGQLYQGFVAASADKIFESTNRLSRS